MDQKSRVLRLPQVMEIVGLGRTSIYALESRGDFPSRVKLTKCASGWVESEVLAWLEQRLGKRAPR